jgi:hypothetical protein
MDTFLQRFAGKIKGVITGFDRIVFKGCLRPLMFAAGAQGFFQSRGILNKDYKAWVRAQSAKLIDAAETYARTSCGRGITSIPSCHERKESIAHARQQALGIQSGLIGVWSCTEACTTYRAHYDAQAGFPQLRRDFARCKHLYFYYDHPLYGFLSVRVQTWFPYGIQIALNGREWLRRSLDKERIDFVLHGNKFLHMADYARAQKLLDAQTDARWLPLLAGFLPAVFPKPELLTRASSWHDGMRIRHWVDKNSVKLYNEQNVLRAEMTMNNPGMFRVFRRPESTPLGHPKRRMALRKGLADIPLRTQVSADVNHRFMEQMATLRDDTPLRDVLRDLTRASVQDGRRIRALDITGKDQTLLLAIADPHYVVCGLTNRRLQQALRTSPWTKGGTDKQLSARISRHLRLFRDHGLIRKMPNQRKYILTEKGRTLTTALNAMLAASTQQLMEKAA